jgi:hypothetical protein
MASALSDGEASVDGAGAATVGEDALARDASGLDSEEAGPPGAGTDAGAAEQAARTSAKLE